MIRKALVGWAIALALLLSAGAAQAQGLPTCRVRVVKSAATEAVPKRVFRQVDAWVNAPERGCRVVSTIDEADVLLEFNQYRPTTTPDGTPAEEWRFIARRLSEPIRHRATFRYGVTTISDHRSTTYVAKELPILLVDVCLGYLPKVALDNLDR